MAFLAAGLAAGASLAAVVIAMPAALGLWLGRPGTGSGISVLAAALLALAVAGRPPGPWFLANVAAGIPVIALAAMSGLRRVPQRSLRIATVSGLSPLAQLRLIAIPLTLWPVLAAATTIFLLIAIEIGFGQNG